jgi:hypothetical protein
MARWVRATWDYNPTFPLSALALLAGLRLMAADGVDSGVAGTAAGIGIVVGYELFLLGAALFVLWPRKIAYETTAILIIASVVRFAAPFLVIGLAADGHLGAALALGVGLALLNAARSEVVVARLGLDLRPWERAYDGVLFALVAVALPLLAERLSVWTGDALSHSDARLLQLGAWWASALLLLPLTRGLDGLGADGSLRSRRPAIVWRCLTALGVAALLGNALWLGGDAPFFLAPLPLIFVAAGLWRAIGEARERPAPALLAHLPSLLVALVLFASPRLLMGTRPVLGHSAATLLFGLLALCFVPVLASPPQRKSALRSLACVAAVAPLRFCASLPVAELYLLVLAVALTCVALARRSDAALATAGAVVAVLSSHGVAVELGGLASLQTAALCGGVLALLVAWRVPAPRAGASLAARVAAFLCLAPAAGLVAAGAPGASSLVCGVASAGALACLAQRHRRGGLKAAAAGQGLALVGRRLTASLDPGVALVALAFAAVPVGTAVAVARERRRQVADALTEDGDGRVREPVRV